MLPFIISKFSDLSLSIRKIYLFFGIDSQIQKLWSREFFCILLLGLVEQIMQAHGLILNSSDVVKICNNLVIYAIAVELISFIANRAFKDENAMKNEAENQIISFYTSFEQVDEFKLILNTSIDLLEKIIYRGLLIFYILAYMPSIYAWIASAITGEFVYFSPIYLPYIDRNSLLGYSLNSFIMVLCTTVFWSIIFAYDFHCTFFYFQIIPHLKVMVYKLQKLGERLSDEKNSDEIDKALIEIVELFQKCQEYKELIDYYTRYERFTSILTGAFSIGLSLVITRFASPTIGCVYVLYYCFRIGTICSIGTIIQIQYDEFLKELCGIPFYNMSKKSRKIFLQFIHCCQNAGTTRLPLIGVVNMELFGTVLNTGYSYLMFIINLVK